MLRHSIYGIKFYSEYITCCFPAIVSNLFFLVFVKLFYLEMVYLRFSSKVDLCYIFNALFYGPFVTSIQGLLNNFPTQFSSINFQAIYFSFGFCFIALFFGFFSYWHFKPLSSSHDTLASVPLQPATALFYANLFLAPSSCPYPSFWL